MSDGPSLRQGVVLLLRLRHTVARPLNGERWAIPVRVFGTAVAYPRRTTVTHGTSRTDARQQPQRRSPMHIRPALCSVLFLVVLWTPGCAKDCHPVGYVCEEGFVAASKAECENTPGCVTRSPQPDHCGDVPLYCVPDPNADHDGGDDAGDDGGQ